MTTTFLIGFMGSGKSTVAKQLADEFLDLDTVIVEKIGMPISDFFDKYGEQAFREIETQILAEVATSKHVIATGGGIINSEENRQILANTTANIVYLKANFDKLYDRIKADKANRRPLFETLTREQLAALYHHRAALYESVATITVDIEEKSPADIVKEILL